METSHFVHWEISRLAAMMGDKKLADEFWTVEKVMNAESPRFIKTHVSLELLPKQLWTVKPKVSVIFVANISQVNG